MSEDTTLTVAVEALKRKTDAPPPFSLEEVVLRSMQREDEMKNKGKVKVRPTTRG